MISHRPAPRLGRADVSRDSGLGLTADAAATARAAATALAAKRAVVKARGTATVERGTPTITLTATIAARTGLASIASAVDEIAETAADMLDDTVAVRTIIRVDRKAAGALQ